MLLFGREGKENSPSGSSQGWDHAMQRIQQRCAKGRGVGNALGLPCYLWLWQLKQGHTNTYVALIGRTLESVASPS